MIKPSLVLLTYNRRNAVERSLTANLASAGYPLHEIIHVDNGSYQGYADWFAEAFKPAVQIRNRENLGVAKGYNRGMLLATGSHIVITGCDRIMPDKWLLKFVEAFEAIPNTGVISMYSDPIDDKDTENSRMRSQQENKNGIEIRRAIPFEARMHSRDLLNKAGFFREDFGLYGYEDCEWAERVERVTFRHGLINYILPDLGLAHHLPDDEHFNITADQTYKQFKRAEACEEKMELVRRCNAQGSPYYNPYFEVQK